jgi:glutathione S-transferase
MKLIIGNKNYSSWSLRAWFMLAANNISFEEIRIPLSTANSHSELKKYSDAAKVPVLDDNETVIWDSLAICEYISEQYLDGKGWPADPMDRAVARSYCAEMHSSFFQIREKMPMNCRAVDRKVEITNQLQKEIERIDNIWSELREKYSSRGPWLFGEFSIVDCMFAPVVFRFASYNVVVSDISSAYMKNLLTHPQIQSWLQQATEELEIIDIDEAGN